MVAAEVAADAAVADPTVLERLDALYELLVALLIELMTNVKNAPKAIQEGASKLANTEAALKAAGAIHDAKDAVVRWASSSQVSTGVLRGTKNTQLMKSL